MKFLNRGLLIATFSAAMVATSACAATQALSSNDVQATPTATVAATAQQIAAQSITTATIQSKGEFEGRSKHITTGGVSVVNTGSGYLVVLDNNFSLDGAPGPTLGFGVDGQFDGKSEFTPLKSKSGAQVYVLPASINPANYNEIYVWCADFSVPLGVAKLGS